MLVERLVPVVVTDPLLLKLFKSVANVCEVPPLHSVPLDQVGAALAARPRGVLRLPVTRPEAVEAVLAVCRVPRHLEWLGLRALPLGCFFRHGSLRTTVQPLLQQVSVETTQTRQVRSYPENVPRDLPG